MGKVHDVKSKVENYLCDNFDCLSSHQICELSEVIKNLSKSIYYCNEVNKNIPVEQEIQKSKVENYKKMMKDDRLKYLENHMNLFNDDLLRMIRGTSPEEKQIALNKLTNIMQHIQNVEV